MATTRAIGIDLGTSSMAVATLDPHGHSQLVADPGGPRRTPIALLVAQGELHFGNPALQLASAHPMHLAELALAATGWSTISTNAPSTSLPPEVLLACALRHAQSHAPPGPTVLSVPCALSTTARRSLVDAARLVNLDWLDLVCDTTAAALAWREQQLTLNGPNALQSMQRLLICDLGASKLSAALVDVQQKGLRILATAGDTTLGGRSWNDCLTQLLSRQHPLSDSVTSASCPAQHRRLLRAVEEAKHTLSARQRAVVEFDSVEPNQSIPVTRDQFEQHTADLTLRVVRCMSDLVRHAGVAWRQIDQLVLLGGAARMPMIGSALQRASGLVPHQFAAGDEAVARGAALYAGRLLATRGQRGFDADYHLVEASTQSLGVAALQRDSLMRHHNILIPRHTPLPTSISADFVTSHPEQRAVKLQILEGESAHVGECVTLGHLILDHLPPNLMAGWPVTVTFEASPGGRLRVRAELEGGQPRAVLDVGRQGRLSEHIFVRWQQLLLQPPQIDRWLALAAETHTRPSSAAEAGEQESGVGDIVVSGLPPASPASGLPSTRPMERSWADMLSRAEPISMVDSSPASKPLWSQPLEAMTPDSSLSPIIQHPRSRAAGIWFATLTVGAAIASAVAVWFWLR